MTTETKTDTLVYPYQLKPVASYMTPEMEADYRAGLLGAPEERVARGAQVLDVAIPGWHQLVKVQTLDLQSKCLCVLGQLFDPLLVDDTLESAGEYGVWRNGYEFIRAGDATWSLNFRDRINGYDIGSRLWQGDEDASLYGYVSRDSFLGFDRIQSEKDELYPLLTEAWKAQIAARVSA